MGEPLLEARILGNLLEKSAFLASKLGNWPLLEHGPVIEGPVIEILRYIYSVIRLGFRFQNTYKSYIFLLLKNSCHR